MGFCPVPSSPPCHHLQVEDEDSASNEETTARTVRKWSVAGRSFRPGNAGEAEGNPRELSGPLTAGLLRDSAGNA